ncbi:hypothetical protein CU633_19695 [Bacillus sp. V3-13]|nr:hypothetical protein CU633_19695 [Bacillus sp. V3-13]
MIQGKVLHPSGEGQKEATGLGKKSFIQVMKDKRRQVIQGKVLHPSDEGQKEASDPGKSPSSR